MGLSLVAYVGIWFFKIYVKSKADNHHTNARLASAAIKSGKKLVPSWAGDRGESQIFIDGIQRGAMRSGVPRVFLLGVLQEPEIFRDFVHYAGAMEAQGASFIEQQVAVSDKLVEAWELAPEAVRRECLT